MKQYVFVVILMLILCISIFVGSIAPCHAIDPYDYLFTRRNSTNTGNEGQFINIPSNDAHGIPVLNGDDKWIDFVTLGDGLVYDDVNKVLNIDVDMEPITKTYDNSVTRPINGTAFQPSSTKDTVVQYVIRINGVLSSGSISLDISSDGSTGWTTISKFSLGSNITQDQTNTLVGNIPIGYYVRLQPSGSATISYIAGQEVTQ